MQKLLAAARANPPADRVPYKFEQRIMARLKEQPALDLAALWARALWRAVAPCAVVAVLIGLLSFAGNGSNPASNPAGETPDFSQHFESVMLADVGEPNEDVW